MIFAGWGFFPGFLDPGPTVFMVTMPYGDIELTFSSAACSKSPNEGLVHPMDKCPSARVSPLE